MFVPDISWQARTFPRSAPPPSSLPFFLFAEEKLYINTNTKLDTSAEDKQTTAQDRGTGLLLWPDLGVKLVDGCKLVRNGLPRIELARNALQHEDRRSGSMPWIYGSFKQIWAHSNKSGRIPPDERTYDVR